MMTPALRGLSLLACALLLNACTLSPARLHAPATALAPPTRAAADPTRVTEAWISPPQADEQLDSLAVWPNEDGDLWVIATAKATHRLVVFDGQTGRRLRTVGGPGSGPGQFQRPNGIAVFGDHVYVSERDNTRVQILSLPEFEPVASFGQAELRLPYGLWVHETAPGDLEVHVTDSFMADFERGLLPPAAQLNQRVRRYRLRFPPPDSGDKAPEVTYQGSNGETADEGVLHMVESIAGDPVHDRLLIADEDRRVGSTLRDYSLATGRYRGHSLPMFDYEAEGVALWSCDMEAGYWVAVDQVPLTRFRLFTRAGLAPAGVFVGKRTARTDGVALHAASTPRFPFGVLYAVHDDHALAAFDLAEVAHALALDPRCLQ